MGQPAARVMDMHTCPMFDGPKPHVGGPILPPCAVTVLTGGMPQARVTDMATCVGPPDMIVKGAMTVLVSGMPAARMGDMTVHGGVIVMGCFTVLIGDAGGGGGGGVASPAPAGSAPGAAAPKAGDKVKIDPDILKKSPTLTKQLEQLEKDGWTIKYGEKGKGSFASKGSKTVTIDPNNTNPETLTQIVAHEVGHALYKGGTDTSSRQAYIDSQLADEGAATLNNVKVQREILKNGGKDIGIAGSKTKEYKEAYDAFEKHGDEAKARAAIGKVFGDGEKTSNTGQSYNDYYGGFYDKNLKPKGTK